jgi:hypothetical protein
VDGLEADRGWDLGCKRNGRGVGWVWWCACNTQSWNLLTTVKCLLLAINIITNKGAKGISYIHSVKNNVVPLVLGAFVIVSKISIK